jgi:hypothetical protein
MKPLPKNKSLLLQKKAKAVAVRAPGKLLLQKVAGMREHIGQLKALVFGDAKGSSTPSKPGTVPSGAPAAAVVRDAKNREGQRRCRRKL